MSNNFSLNNKASLAAVLGISFILSSVSPQLFANSAHGLWRTESSDQGYLIIEFTDCDKALCGTIHSAFDTDDTLTAGYEHQGKLMVWNMMASGDKGWVNGKIWDPTKDKTYKSKMSINGDDMEVSGCVLFVCRSQTWKRVE